MCEQVLVAKVNLAYVVLSIRQPSLKTGFIDRFLVACEAYHVTPAIIINKIDLARKRDLELLDELTSLYEGLGYRILLTSISDPESVEMLIRNVTDKTSVFIGPSGTGKTSLLYAIDPELDLRTGEVSSYSSKGKHTTTFARLISISDEIGRAHV